MRRSLFQGGEQVRCRFLAARDLCLEGLAQPSGYTEPILHRRRAARKAELAELAGRAAPDAT